MMKRPPILSVPEHSYRQCCASSAVSLSFLFVVGIGADLLFDSCLATTTRTTDSYLHCKSNSE